MPDTDWVAPALAEDTGSTVVIKNSINGQPLAAPNGLAHKTKVNLKEGDAIEFVLVGDRE